MPERNFMDLLRARWAEGKFVCVGLDTDVARINDHFPDGMSLFGMVSEYNQRIIAATHDLVCAYKPNIAFYEGYGSEGLDALRHTIRTVRSIAPEVPVILDAKRGDIGKSNQGYVRLAFEWLDADAITIHPYLGQEANQPFLDRRDKGVFVLCRTSNSGAGEFQDVGGTYRISDSHAHPLYETVAEHVAKQWNANGNCGLVAGATYPEELAKIRQLVGDVPLLIPGIGAQGGDVEKTVQAGADSNGQGMIINSSSGIIFASKESDYAEAARRATEKLAGEITGHLATAVA